MKRILPILFTKYPSTKRVLPPSSSLPSSSLNFSNEEGSPSHCSSPLFLLRLQFSGSVGSLSKRFQLIPEEGVGKWRWMRVSRTPLRETTLLIRTNKMAVDFITPYLANTVPIKGTHIHIPDFPPKLGTKPARQLSHTQTPLVLYPDPQPDNWPLYIHFTSRPPWGSSKNSNFRQRGWWICW